MGEASEQECISWNYYPPNTFKVLIFFPEYDMFIVSGVYERYTFDGYYTVTIDEDVLQLATLTGRKMKFGIERKEENGL